MFRERGFCSIEEVDQSRPTSPCRYKLEIKDNEDHEVIFYQNEAIKDIKTFLSYPNDHLVLLRSDIVKVTFLDQLMFVPKNKCISLFGFNKKMKVFSIIAQNTN